ncbi:MAG TPA: redoxin domain-containing protein, partial [Gemmataceae bacterium]|nr:redoxin domain-containing protein [Gemmataceae bacterium]
MRTLLTAAMAALFLVSTVQAEDQSKEAPKVVLRSPDGKKSYDLGQLTAAGPVLVRLTCACSGCDQELPFFQKLQAAYDGKGLKTLAVFREKAEDASNYVLKKNIQFMWL